MFRPISLLALLAVVATSGCGGSANRDNPYYAATSVRHKALSQKDKGAMVRQLGDLVEGRQIVWIDPSGATRKIQPGGEGLGAMDLAPLHAVWMASEDKYLGAELDIMVTTKGQSRTPVSVMVGLKGDIKVISAPESGPRALPDPPDSEALRSRYGIGSLDAASGSSWDKAALQALELSLSRLSKGELAVLRKLPFERRARARDKSKGALYVQKGCGARILIYDAGFEAARHQFVGTPDKPLPPAAMITLHEIGHALHERPSRLASCDYDRRVKALQKRQEAFNDDIARRNRLAKRSRKDPASGRKVKALDARLEPERKALLKEQRALETEQKRIGRMASRGPVIAAYQTALGDLGAPTPYGGTSSKESFAEAFALFHVDPDALRRSLPKVHAWFESDGHLEALKKGQSK